MALNVYDNTQVTQYSNNLTPSDPLYQPIRIIKNGITNDDIEILLYLNNDSAVTSYNDVVLTPTPSTKIGPSSIDGWWIKIISGINGAPTQSDWDALAKGNSITYDDPTYYAASIFTFPPTPAYFYPFYIRFHAPNGASAQVSRGVSIQIDFTAV